MNRRSVLSLSASSALGLALLSGNAVAQQKTIKEQLVDTWNVVAVDAVRKDGTRVQLFGPDPRGSIVYGRDGHFSLIFVRADIPKLASSNRAKATPEEAAAVVAGSIAYFGKYHVDETSKIVTIDIEASTFANQVGSTTDNQRLITLLTASELKFTNPAATSGVTIEVTCKRAI
jgi:lipocalin-like protein